MARRLRHDVGDGQAVFLAQRHVDARHQREVECHVAFVAIAEIGTDIGRPHVGFGEDETIRILRVNGGANLFDLDVRLGHVFAVGAVALDQIWDGVQAQGIDTHIEPEAHGLEYFFHHPRVVEVQVRLMREEAVPVVLLGGFIPGPVGLFGVGEDDASVLVELVGVAPDIHIALRRTGRRGRAALNHGC